MTYKNHTPSTRRNHWYWHFGKHLRARSVCACEGTWLSEPPNWPWMQTREGMNGRCGSKEEIGSREINPHRCSHKRHLPQLHRWHFSGWKKTRQTLNSFTLGQKHTHTQTRTPHAIIHPSLVPLAHSLSRSSSEMEKQLLCTFPISHSDFCKRMAVDFQHGRKVQQTVTLAGVIVWSLEYAWVSPHKHMLNIQIACAYGELTALC